MDIDRIVEFNNRRNLSDTYSRKFITGLNKRLKLLSFHPLTGIAIDEENILLLIWDQFYLFYSFDDTTIDIKAIYHQREDIIP